MALLGVAWRAELKAQTPPLNTVWVYTLVGGSQLTDDCPICDHVTVPVPMRGTFQLRFLGQGPLFDNYAVENVSFAAGETTGRAYKVVGKGTYRVGGEVGLQQDLFLEVIIDDGVTNQLCDLTNASPNITRRWPMLQASVVQSNGTLARQFRLDINAAPFREIWFSTVTNFVAGIWNSPTNSVSGGDLLSSSGRVVKRNQQLTAKLGIQPPVPDVGLNDTAVLPGGEIAFSIAQNLFSENLGPIWVDDLLTDRGRILGVANQDLIAAFLPTAPLPEHIGLGAVQFMDDGEIVFSVQNAFGSKKLGVTLHPGDLLSNSGTMVKSGKQLFAPFSPLNPTNDIGLKAIYVWPSGESWFSTRDGFYDTRSNYFSAGDLLSDQGYIVYHNTELLSAFAPITGSTDLGLDALFVVTDVTPAGAPSTLSLPQFTNQPPASLVFQRAGGGRVFQLEGTTNATGPFLPATSITTETEFIAPRPAGMQTQGFYRLHQW